MPPPNDPKIYHIIHVDRLQSVVADGQLWCDEIIARRATSGTTIGMSHIKARRLANSLASHPGLRVGQCVPFYFCPRSVMLYLIHRANDRDLNYRGGQEPILHFETDLHAAVDWANAEGRRWAFSLSNAGAAYFEDRCDIGQLDEINWVYPGFPTLFWGLSVFFVGDLMGKALWKLVENAARFPRRGGRVLCVHGAVSFHRARPCGPRWLPGRGAMRHVELDRRVLGLQSTGE